MRGLFQEARKMVRVGKVTRKDYVAALDGLEALRAAYAGDSSRQRRKANKLDAVIEEIWLPTQGEGEFLIRFRENYIQYLTYGLSQHLVLKRQDQGICQALVIHWARRILNGKGGSYADKNGQKHAPAAVQHPDQLAWMAKRLPKLRDLQKDIDEPDDRGAGPWDKRKYAGVFLRPLTQGTEFDEHSKPIGSDIFQDAIGRAKQKKVNLIMLSLLGKVKREGQYYTATGHAIGIDLLEIGDHIFDPNVGEFTFSAAHQDTERKFCDELWTALYDEDYRGYQVLSIEKE
jgi:hypothetical protein